MAAFFVAARTAILAAWTAVKSQVAVLNLPWYYYGFALCFCFGFVQGCRCDRPRLFRANPPKLEAEQVSVWQYESEPVNTYRHAFQWAQSSGKPVAVFVGCGQRKVDGFEVCQSLPGGGFPGKPCVIVGDAVAGGECLELPAASTDEEILAAYQKLKEKRAQAVAPVVQYQFLGGGGCPNGRCPGR